MSAPTHTVQSVQQFLTKNSMTLVPHPPCSPDLTLGNFFFVSPMKKVLKEKRLADVEKVKQSKAEALKGIKIAKVKNCLEWWEKHLNECITSNGEYFERDWSLNM